MQARAGIIEVHFLPFNPVDKQITIKNIDRSGNWHRVSKGAPKQVSNLYDLIFVLFLYANDILKPFILWRYAT